MIFCTSVEPFNQHEWRQWSKALDDDYNHVTYIHRPRAFARELGSMEAEHLGPRGQLSSLTHAFEGLPTFSTDHPTQWILHGAVIYADDVYGLVEATASMFEFMLQPLFAKAKIYEAQREYRFVIWTETEPAEPFEVLSISQGVADIIGEGRKDGPPQWKLDSELAKGELVSTESDTTKQDGPKPEFAQESCNGLGRSLLQEIEEANSLETELFRIFARAKDPATVHRPREISADDLPDNLRATTAIYSAVEALRSKVSEYQEIDDGFPERRLGVTSAAWFAEQDIRALRPPV